MQCMHEPKGLMTLPASVFRVPFSLSVSCALCMQIAIPKPIHMSLMRGYETPDHVSWDVSATPWSWTLRRGHKGQGVKPSILLSRNTQFI